MSCLLLRCQTLLEEHRACGTVAPSATSLAVGLLHAATATTKATRRLRVSAARFLSVLVPLLFFARPPLLRQPCQHARLNRLCLSSGRSTSSTACSNVERPMHRIRMCAALPCAFQKVATVEALQQKRSAVHAPILRRMRQRPRLAPSRSERKAGHRGAVLPHICKNALRTDKSRLGTSARSHPVEQRAPARLDGVSHPRHLVALCEPHRAPQCRARLGWVCKLESLWRACSAKVQASSATAGAATSKITSAMKVWRCSK